MYQSLRVFDRRVYWRAKRTPGACLGFARTWLRIVSETQCASIMPIFETVSKRRTRPERHDTLDPYEPTSCTKCREEDAGKQADFSYGFDVSLIDILFVIQVRPAIVEPWATSRRLPFGIGPCAGQLLANL